MQNIGSSLNTQAQEIEFELNMIHTQQGTEILQNEEELCEQRWNDFRRCYEAKRQSTKEHVSSALFHVQNKGNNQTAIYLLLFTKRSTEEQSKTNVVGFQGAPGQWEVWR